MSNIQVHKPVFSLQPTNFQEAMQYAKLLAESNFVPKDYMGKPNNILAAIQYGAEIGLKPLQSLQNVAVINGRPSIWGDAAKALVEAHPSCISIDEQFDEEKFVATCIAKRKNKPDVIRTFSKEKAMKAGLWDKTGPWKGYPDRMVQMRARGFALRDQFPDVLLGLILAEEAEDYKIVEAEPIEKEKENIVPINTTASTISIHEPSPPSTYRFVELDATFTKDMTVDEALKYFFNKIESLNNNTDLENYEKFKKANEKLLKIFSIHNRQEAMGLGHSLNSRKDYIKRTMKAMEEEEAFEYRRRMDDDNREVNNE